MPLKLLFAIVLAVAPAAANQSSKPRTDEKLPPLSYVCPMVGDEDVIEDSPGKCRKCGMELKPVRLDSVWTCPVHAAVIRDKAGKCPIDGRDLVQVTMSVSWTCANQQIDVVTPGTCPDGSPMVKKYTPRAHGNHNPQHGGLFFMAPDNWHHLEGTYPRAGVFRMYVYDDFTKPLPREQARKITGTVVMADGTATQLALAPNGRYLEAKIPRATVPAEMFAKVRFKADGPENRFDFAFPTYSKEQGATGIVTASAQAQPKPPEIATARPGPAASAVAAPTAPATSPAPASGVDPGLVPLPIPDTVPEMLVQLAQRMDQIKRFIDTGAFANVYVPAFQAKDLALALDQRRDELPADRRKIAEPAIKQLVRSAWLLDAFGDLGNKEQITQAYAQFAAAVKQVEAAFPDTPGKPDEL